MASRQQIHCLEELKYFSMDLYIQYVVIPGTWKMPLLYADNWVISTYLVYLNILFMGMALGTCWNFSVQETRHLC